MINLMPMPNCIEQLKGKVSFSNYQIVLEKKFEKAVILFNKELEERFLINNLMMNNILFIWTKF